MSDVSLLGLLLLCHSFVVLCDLVVCGPAVAQHFHVLPQTQVHVATHAAQMRYIPVRLIFNPKPQPDHGALLNVHDTVWSCSHNTCSGLPLYMLLGAVGKPSASCFPGKASKRMARGTLPLSAHSALVRPCLLNIVCQQTPPLLPGEPCDMIQCVVLLASLLMLWYACRGSCRNGPAGFASSRESVWC